MKRIRLTAEEKEIEEALLRGEYRPVSAQEFYDVSQALERRKKSAVLNLRVNQQDLDDLKEKARKLGVPYQSMISEMLHRFATQPAPPLKA